MYLANQTTLSRDTATAAHPRADESRQTAVATIVAADEAIDRLASEWIDLAGDASEPNSFAEHWFVAASLAHLGIGRDIRLAEVRRAGRLIGIMPLSAEVHYGRLTVAFIQNWCHHHAFLGTPLVRRGEEQAFWTALFGALDTHRPGNFLHLRAFGEGGPVHRGLVEALAAMGRRGATVHRESRALLESGLDPKAYYESTVRSKKRKEIRRLQGRLAEKGEVRARRLEDEHELGAWCDAFLAIEKGGWKGEAGSALACAPQTEAFFRAAVAGAWAADRLDFLRLDLDGRPIAMLVNFMAAPGGFSFKTGFDEAYSRFSPGVLIQIENLAILDRPDIGWMDSCAIEDHPMIDSLWSGRRTIVRVTIPLKGARRKMIFIVCRALESGSALLRRLTRKTR